MPDDIYPEQELTTVELNPPCPKCGGRLRPCIAVTAEAVVTGDLCFNCNHFISFQPDAEWLDRWILSVGKEFSRGVLTDEQVNVLLEMKDKKPSNN